MTDQRDMITVPNWILPMYGIDKLKPFTQERKDAWVARLESAESNKALGNLHTDDNASCALGHLQIVDNDFEHFGVPYELYNKIVELNDEQQLSLPEIAIWVKENVEVTD